jgi:hypothetical protein
LGARDPLAAVARPRLGCGTRAPLDLSRGLVEHVGQRNLGVTANTYSHVLVDEAELEHATLLY